MFLNGKQKKLQFNQSDFQLSKSLSHIVGSGDYMGRAIQNQGY